MPRCFNGIRLLPVVSTLVFLAALGAARAEDFCANIDSLIDQSRSGFAAIADKPKGDTGDREARLTLAGASTCLVTRKAKRSWYRCAWAFPYRAKRAADTFDALAGKLDGCLARRATPHGDRSVNHPDSYAARRYELEQADVSLSVKDKAGLGKTFVFIRVQGRNGGRIWRRGSEPVSSIGSTMRA